MKITKEQVDKFACEDGRAWFAENFPQGGEYGDVIQALNADKRYEWARWGAGQAYSLFLLGKTTTEFINAETATTDAMVDELNGMKFPPDQVDVSKDKGEDDARIGSSGNDARIGSSGYCARIESTGEKSVVAVAGSVLRLVLGEGGCAAVPYNDGERTRFAFAYVGEKGIKANTPYTLNTNGEFIEAE